jgi:hypothetical protein
LIGAKSLAAFGADWRRERIPSQPPRYAWRSAAIPFEPQRDIGYPGRQRAIGAATETLEAPLKTGWLATAFAPE